MYQINKDKARNSISSQSCKDFDDIVEQRVLGASTHIKMIGEMIENIAIDCIENKLTVQIMRERIVEVCNFFIYTRGEASQAIENSINLMTKNIQSYSNNENIKNVAQKIIDIKNNYFISSKQEIEKAIEYAVNIGKSDNTILVYDYSSSVAEFLKKLPEGKTIFIPESRAINGGTPYLEILKNLTHKIHFIPDAGLMYYMTNCDSVFMGAETIYPNGTGFNTIGSDIVGLLCNYYKIPLYFITTLIKLDLRPIYGKKKELVINNLHSVFEPIIKTKMDHINYDCPELIGVPSKYITGFITEEGIIPSNQLFNIALAYSKKIKGEI